MNSFAARAQHVEEFGCNACKGEIEELGPVQGPQPLPHPSVSRWSMTREEWAGQE